MSLLEQLFSKRSETPAAHNFARMQEVCALLHNPQYAFSAVHIAGTNGKGSVAIKIASTLEHAGYKVGLFTSPHIERVSERIQINGVEMPLHELERRAEILMQRFPDLHFFNYITLLAFQWFAEKEVDIAVIEAGIGGTFDATNCVRSLISIITSVALDHTELLGETVEEIAAQKAGIIRPGVPVVLGPRVDQIAGGIRAGLKRCDYDLENQQVASYALTILKRHFTIGTYLLDAKPPCRFERLGRFILDVAHNPAGITALLNTWDVHHPGTPFSAIVGLSIDKDLARCLRPLTQRADHLFLVEAASARAAPLARLVEAAKTANFTPCRSIEEAVHLSSARKPPVLVCGSFFIMQEARQQISRLEVSGNEPLLSRGEFAHQHPDGAPVILC